MQSKSQHRKILRGLCITTLMTLLPFAAQADQLAEVKKAGELVIGTEMQFCSGQLIPDTTLSFFSA